MFNFDIFKGLLILTEFVKFGRKIRQICQLSLSYKKLKYQGAQIKCSSMVTLKTLPHLAALFQRDYFVAFGPLILSSRNQFVAKNYSLVSILLISY